MSTCSFDSIVLIERGEQLKRRRRGKRKSVREAEGDVADCEEEEVEHEGERSEDYILNFIPSKV